MNFMCIINVIKSDYNSKFKLEMSALKQPK
jgi:hypothetical protein